LGRTTRIDIRADAPESGKVIHPQTNLQAVLVRQLAGESPADTDVAVVIDNAAEDIPGLWRLHLSICY
jgi:hypothetical protein